MPRVLIETTDDNTYGIDVSDDYQLPNGLYSLLVVVGENGESLGVAANLMRSIRVTSDELAVA